MISSKAKRKSFYQANFLKPINWMGLTLFINFYLVNFHSSVFPILPFYVYCSNVCFHVWPLNFAVYSRSGMSWVHLSWHSKRSLLWDAYEVILLVTTSIEHMEKSVRLFRGPPIHESSAITAETMLLPVFSYFFLSFSFFFSFFVKCICGTLPV